MKILTNFFYLLVIFINFTNVAFAQDIPSSFLDFKNSKIEHFENKLNYFQDLKEITEQKKYRVPILMYHYIGSRNNPDDSTKNSLSTWPQVLENQIRTLKNDGFNFITIHELSNIIERNSDLPEKRVVLTFDDGHKDFYTNAYPILKKYNIKATIYVITGFLNHSNHLSTNELIKLSNDEKIEIGAHTVNHEWLKDVHQSIVEHETLESKKQLENLIQKEVTSFAYPYGAFDDTSVDFTKRAGYNAAVSTLPGILQSKSNLFFLHRLRPGERVEETLLNWLSQDKFFAF